MINERKEPTFSATPKPTGGAASQSPTKSNASRPKQAPRQQVVVQKQSSGLLWLTFLIALGAAAAVGYTFWQFTLSQQVIVEQQQRIDELENKLLLSGDESTQSLTVLAANLKGLDKDVKLAMTEVDKLWGTRNANRKEIADTKKQLETDIGQAKKTLGTLEGKISKSEGNITKFEGSITKMENSLTKTLSPLQQRSAEQELLIQSLRERVSEQEQTLQSISASTKQYVSINKDLSKLSNDINAISQKLKAYDETVRSFDKFRVTTNRDLIVLKQRAGVPPK